MEGTTGSEEVEGKDERNQGRGMDTELVIEIQAD